jgi:hypothetical protein
MHALTPALSHPMGEGEALETSREIGDSASVGEAHLSLLF